MKPTLLVLAAGMGSRFGGLKQIKAVGPDRATIVDYSVYDAIRSGFGKVVFVIRREIEADFRAVVGRRFEQHVAVEYVHQALDLLPPGFRSPSNRTRPWGTGHAVWVSRQAINEPFAAINADDFYGVSSFRILGDYLRSIAESDSAAYAMVGFELRKTLSDFGTVSRGVCQVDGDGYLKHVVELRQVAKDRGRVKYVDEFGQTHVLSGSETVSMNMWGFAPSIFDHLHEQIVDFLRQGDNTNAEFFTPTVVDTLIARDLIRVRVFPSQDTWFGITYREDHRYVVKCIQDLIERGIYPEKLWA
jgi:NDP-sugar pyrophosphorylase family protein